MSLPFESSSETIDIGDDLAIAEQSIRRASAELICQLGGSAYRASAGLYRFSAHFAPYYAIEQAQQAMGFLWLASDTLRYTGTAMYWVGERWGIRTQLPKGSNTADAE